MKTFMGIILCMLVTSFAKAHTLECKIANSQDQVWITSIHINEQNREITLIESEAQGKRTYKTKLIDLSDERYTFNLSPQENSGVTNMFLLFKSFGNWRLLSVGVEEKSGTAVLRAVDEAKEYKCFKK